MLTVLLFVALGALIAGAIFGLKAQSAAAELSKATAELSALHAEVEELRSGKAQKQEKEKARKSELEELR